MPLVNKLITGYSSGLTQNKKPFLLPDQAWQTLENGYVWRERVRKREGTKLLGRLRRDLAGSSLGVTPAGPDFINFANVLTTIGIAGEPDAELEPGSLLITIVAPDAATFTDNGDGTLAVTGAGVAAGSYVNYATGEVNLQFAGALTGGAAITATTLHYYPSLPVMGILEREVAAINDEQTIWFDTKYAYIYSGTNFDEFITGTTWSSTNSDFFQGFNYRGVNPGDRLLFVTNFVSTAANPMRYTDGITWTTFAPLVAAADTLYSARILVAYYGRLVALNVWEGTTAGGAAAATNLFNRCRFSQVGSPLDVDAFRTDIFGRGGYLDAPTNEAIIGATFIKNTLVVTFERTTWQLRYVGEYGMPFVWERISADFGSESTFSSVLFDNHMLAVGDKAIIAANGAGVDRIDLDIPDLAYLIKNENDGVKRVFGIRDYQKELVYWNYPDANTQAAPGVNTIFPNKVLLYNYRNGTWATFRDNVTALGRYQLQTGITWGSTDVFWDDENVFWDDVDTQALFPSITCGNQQGFVSLYAYQTSDDPTLTIRAIDLTVSPIVITSPDHNLQPGELILISDLAFIDSSTSAPLATDLNDQIYRVTQIDADTFSISKWNTTLSQYASNFSFTPTGGGSTLYVGGGRITLLSRLNVKTKDFNLFQDKGLQTKLSHIDFLVETTPNAAMSVILYLNSSPTVMGNMLVGNQTVSTAANPSFYPPSNTSDYAWFSFYATIVGQYFNINITYDDTLMNTLSTHQQKWVLLAINAAVRPGGDMTR